MERVSGVRCTLSVPHQFCGVKFGVGRNLRGSNVQDRIAIWINPWSDPQGTGYQLVQALIAIGSLVNTRSVPTR